MKPGRVGALVAVLAISTQARVASAVWHTLARATQAVVDEFIAAPFSTAPAAARIARTIVPSTRHGSQSKGPSPPSQTREASRVRPITPSRRQELKW